MPGGINYSASCRQPRLFFMVPEDGTMERKYRPAKKTNEANSYSSATVAAGAFAFTDAIPLSLLLAASYISLLPMI